MNPRPSKRREGLGRAKLVRRKLKPLSKEQKKHAALQTAARLVGRVACPVCGARVLLYAVEAEQCLRIEAHPDSVAGNAYPCRASFKEWD
jgi:hypothetical protein